MGILNKITIGTKLLLEVDADPSSNATPAPIGSQAFFNDGGMGKSYLKFGSLDTDWSAVQTGSEPSDWKFTTDANQLNVATALSYFGTKAGSNFNIEFQRNGVGVFRLENDVFNLLASEIRKSTGTMLLNAQNGSIDLTSATGSIFLTAQAGSITSVSQENVNSLRYLGLLAIRTKELSYRAVPLNPANTDMSTFLSGVASREKMAKFFIYLKSDDGVNLVMEKTVHVDSNDALVLIQDDFTSKSAVATNITANITYSGGNYQVTVSNMAGFTNKVLAIKMEERAMF